MSTNPFDFQLPILEPGHAGGSGKGFLTNTLNLRLPINCVAFQR
jgi:hypothetical protein